MAKVPTRTGKKKVCDENVYQKALERAEYLIDTFDHVMVSFSGGKDSTATFQVLLEVATHKKKLPLHVLTFDEEAIPPETVEYMQRIAERDDIRFDWYCIPVQCRNACSRHSPWWYPWAPEDKDIWTRELPPNAITECPPGFSRNPISDTQAFLIPKGKRTAVALGIRTSESLTRFRAIASKSGELAFIVVDESKAFSKAYPVYDWSTEDIWHAPHVFGWDYNKAYDKMRQCGISNNEARCSPAFGEQPLRRLHSYQKCWPELWDKMLLRVPGAATAARYANTSLYGFRSENIDGMTYKASLLSKINSCPPDTQRAMKNAVSEFIRLHKSYSSEPMPDAEPNRESGCSWKLAFQALSSLGNNKGRQFQKMASNALRERRKYQHEYNGEATSQ